MDPDLLNNLLDQHGAWLPTRSRPARRRNDRAWFSALRKAGARESTCSWILPELLSPSASPFPRIVPLGEGTDAKAIGELLCGGGGDKGPVSWPTCATVHNAVFAGSSEASSGIDSSSRWSGPNLPRRRGAGGHGHRDRPDSRRRYSPGGRGDLAESARRAGRGPDHRCNSWPELDRRRPDPDPEPRVQFLVQAKDAEAAQALNGLGKKQPAVCPPVAPASPLRSRCREACRKSRGRGRPGSDHGHD